ncbi:hypothetical protein JL720_16767 [Aureococcus anophagefferens]|nr:hypothetical protein JL720_16767 [Aureococcus anophagefferens]
MRRRSRLPTPSNVRNNKTAQEDVPIEGARLEALRAHAKRSVAASHAAAAAPPKAPWSEAATALLSICFFVALCVMGFWLEGDLESARKRQAGDCAFEEDVAGYVWPALTLPGEGLNGGAHRRATALDWDDRGELGLVEQQLALDADVAWAQADAATDPPFKVGIGPCGWQGRFIRTVLDARRPPVRSWYDPARPLAAELINVRFRTSGAGWPPG